MSNKHKKKHFWQTKMYCFVCFGLVKNLSKKTQYDTNCKSSCCRPYRLLSYHPTLLQMDSFHLSANLHRWANGLRLQTLDLRCSIYHSHLYLRPHVDSMVASFHKITPFDWSRNCDRRFRNCSWYDLQYGLLKIEKSVSVNKHLMFYLHF